jgi:hypothetical protein
MEAGQLSRIIEKATGHIWVLVRDDAKTTGFVYAAPQDAMTSMVPFTPEQFVDQFDWYVTTEERMQAVAIDKEQIKETPNPRNRGGRPKGAKDKKPRKRRPDIAVPKDWKPDPEEVAMAEASAAARAAEEADQPATE